MKFFIHIAFLLAAFQGLYSMERSVIQEKKSFFDGILYLIGAKPLTESDILLLLEQGRVEEAKEVIRVMFYNKSSKVVPPSLNTICKVAFSPAGKEVLPLLLDVLSDDISYSLLLVLVSILHSSVQDEQLSIIESLNRIFETFYENKRLISFRDTHTLDPSFLMYPFFAFYTIISREYLAAFDRAAYNGKIESLKKLIHSPYLNAPRYYWGSIGNRERTSPYVSALHAALLGRQKETILYLLKNGAVYNSPHVIEKTEMTEIQLMEQSEHDEIKNLLEEYLARKEVRAALEQRAFISVKA